MTVITAEELLAGPRGRDLCLTALCDISAEPDLWDLVTKAGDVAGLTDAVAAADLATVAASSDPLAYFDVLCGMVSTAVYWQNPWDVADERRLARPDIRSALLPVASAILSAPGLRWWAAPVDLARQYFVQFLGDRGYPDSYELDLSGAAAGLARWSADDDEGSGHWWASPVWHLPHTFPLVDVAGLVGLPMLEDTSGWVRARSWTLRPAAAARVYEVTGQDAWAQLVNRYPHDVTRSRSKPWGATTGLESRWLIPDYAAVAADWDGVHVSLLGYLASAGAAMAVEGGHTVLAGWEPHATWWLTNSLAPAGLPQDWAEDDEESGAPWHPVDRPPAHVGVAAR